MAGSGTASGGDSLADGSGEDAIIVRLRALSCALACSLGSLRVGREKEKEKRIFRSASSSSSSRERTEKGSAVGVLGTRHGDRGGLAIARARDPEGRILSAINAHGCCWLRKKKEKEQNAFRDWRHASELPKRALGKSGHPPVVLRAIFPSIALAVVRSRRRRRRRRRPRDRAPLRSSMLCRVLLSAWLFWRVQMASMWRQRVEIVT